MKITNHTQQVAQEEFKNKALNGASLQKTKDTSNAKIKHNAMDTNDIHNNPSAQQIKQINLDIGKLQVTQKSLKTMESDAKKYAQLSEEYKENSDKTEQMSMKKEMSILKKNIESIYKKATFEGQNVFSKNIKDSNEQVIFHAQKLNMNLLNANPDEFYGTLKEQQTQIKDALQTLQTQAQNSTAKLTLDNTNNKDVQHTDSSFLKKFSSLFRVSHDTQKLNSHRVQELLI
ncbi:hypothetical protein [Helicobacter marmotae]|uniref:Uncharacterized protein n=1 Tax=Helicobacter marmotae TaxID=152490 RepID=A0A3D8I5V9_9HELI|nr:hypothetical protein [Helicobacter marmotae]RDU60560.1 hypothetical protein CQA63_03195 [Helicobacter marmotae]